MYSLSIFKAENRQNDFWRIRTYQLSIDFWKSFTKIGGKQIWTFILLFGRFMNSDIHFLVAWDLDFHYRFQLIKSKIKQISYLGDISLLSKKILGIVGPRKQSEYGIHILHKLFQETKDRDLVTVSGMAEGIDQLCHHLSMQHGIPTIAVLGWGIQRYLDQPAYHIIHQIIENGGLVLSEYPADMKPEYYTFPARNRIIAGLSDVLFVPEAGKKSWSLITVNNALDMGKPVFATANSLFSPSSEGIHALLEEKKISLVYDFAKFLGKFFSRKEENNFLQSADCNLQPAKHLSDQELKIITTLSQRSECWIQDLVADIGIGVGELVPMLTMLEMENCIYQSMPGVYSVK